MAGFNLDDYVSVNERVEAFYKSHPEGSIQSEIHTLTDKLVIVKALAFRGPDDALPCVAHSQLGIPGTTSFTRGSEVENAETSAVGRALAMMGFEVKRGLASREEVSGKAVPPKPTTADESTPAAHMQPAEKTAKPIWQDKLQEILNDHGLKSADLAAALGERVTTTSLNKYIEQHKDVDYRVALEALVLSAKEKKGE